MATTTTTTEAARAVASNAHARRQQAALDAKNAAEALNDPARYTPADTTTPLVGRAPLEQIPEPPAAPAAKVAARKFSISTEIAYRGRVLTVTAEGMTIDQFCDLMDDRGYQAPLALAAPIATADDLPDGYKLCRKHGAPMKPRNKQGEWWHSHNVGTAENPLWCKGYKGSDSPGYDI